MVGKGRRGEVVRVMGLVRGEEGSENEREKEEEKGRRGE